MKRLSLETIAGLKALGEELVRLDPGELIEMPMDDYPDFKLLAERMESGAEAVRKDLR